MIELKENIRKKLSEKELKISHKRMSILEAVFSLIIYQPLIILLNIFTILIPILQQK